jgi:hypothetical protein
VLFGRKHLVAEDYLNVKTEIADVAVFDDIILALEKGLAM